MKHYFSLFSILVLFGLNSFANFDATEVEITPIRIEKNLDWEQGAVASPLACRNSKADCINAIKPICDRSNKTVSMTSNDPACVGDFNGKHGCYCQ